MNDDELRKRITDMFVFEYLPKIKEEVSNFVTQSYSKNRVAEFVSGIVGRSVGVKLGVLKVAEPTNQMIDNLVKLYGETRNK